MNIRKLLIFLAISLFFFIPSAFPSGPENLPVAAWNFNGIIGEKIQEKGANGIVGYPHGITSVSVKGGQALKFDGIDDYIDFGVNPSLNFRDQDFSIELAFNPSNLKKDSTLMTINGASGFLVQIGRDYGDKLIMFLNGWDNYRYSKVNAVKTGYWTHVIFVKKGGNLDCYIDGLLSNGAVAAIPASVNTLGNLYLGGAAGFGFFPGLIDEVKIYNRALSPEEIELHHQHLPFSTSQKYIIRTSKKIAKYTLIIAMILFVIYMRVFWARRFLK